MSLLDLLSLRRKASALLHLERHRASLLTQVHGRWQLTSEVPFTGTALRDSVPLRQAMAQVLAHLPSPSHVTALCDSAWAPIAMLQTGSAPLADAAMLALARHRFSEVHGADAATWQYSFEYRPGDRQALAFALPRQVDQAIQSLHEENLVHSVSVVATTAWIWNNVWRKGAMPAKSWLIATEQDRSLGLAMQHGRCTAFQPAGPIMGDLTEAKAFVETEANRFGLAGDPWPIHGFAFQPFGQVKNDTVQQGLQWTVLLPPEPVQ